MVVVVRMSVEEEGVVVIVVVVEVGGRDWRRYTGTVLIIFCSDFDLREICVRDEPK